MAETIYWTGRYLERAETAARVVQVHGETHFDLPLGADVGWLPLMEIFGDHPGGETGADVTEDDVVTHVLTDLHNPSSVMSALTAARANLRDARPLVPREAWEVLHNLWHWVRTDARRVVDRDVRVGWLRRIVEECQRLTGVLEGSMRRDEAYAFLQMGQQIERSEMTCRVLAARAHDAVGTSLGDSYRDAHQMAILRSLCAYHPFRRAVTVQPDSTSLLRFVVQDQRLPHSVNVALAAVADHAKGLPHNEGVLTACVDATVGVAGTTFTDADELHVRARLHELLDLIARVHTQVVQAYFFSKPGPEQSTTLSAGDNAVTGVAPAWRSTGPARQRANIRPVGSERRLRVTHVTTYDYDGPVDHSYNEAHLCPRDMVYQRRLSHDLEIDPSPSTSSRYTDPFGNTVVTFGVAGGFERMSVVARSDVAVTARPEPPSGLPWESVRTILDIDRSDTGREARRHRAASRLVPTSPLFAEYAAESFTPRRPLVDAARDLMGRVHRDFVYEPGFTSVMTPIIDVFEHRRGVCQDFAHLMVACLRSLGLSARYVSGYVEPVAAPGTPVVLGADASHAWASVYCPGWGWLDLDPTNDQVVDDAYITTAWGRDYWDVSPLRGSVEGGGASHRLQVSVAVEAVA